MIDFGDEDLEVAPDGDELALGIAGMMPEGYTTGQIPGDLLCREDRLLWQRIVMATLLGQAPANPTERLIRDVLGELRQTKQGKTITVAAVLTGVRIAVAQAHGIKVRTHMRGVARHLGVRYQTLLRIRSTAARLIRRDGLDLRLPDWLKWDWSP